MTNGFYDEALLAPTSKTPHEVYLDCVYNSC